MPCLQGKWQGKRDDGLGQMRRLQRDGKGAQVNLLCTRERKARRRAYHAGRNAIADEAEPFICLLRCYRRAVTLLPASAEAFRGSAEWDDQVCRRA